MEVDFINLLLKRNRFFSVTEKNLEKNVHTTESLCCILESNTTL